MSTNGEQLFAQPDGECAVDGGLFRFGAGLVVALHGFEVPSLIDGFRRQDFLSEASLFAAIYQRAQRHFGIEGHDAQVTVQIAVVKDEAVAHEAVVIFQNAFRARDAVRFAFDFQAVSDQVGVYPQTRFDEPDVFIASAEKAFDAFADTHAGFH